jgi:hypothetical protein
MKKSDIQQFRIDILSENQSALSMMLARDGNIARQGNGSLPADSSSVTGTDGGSIFSNLIAMLDENIFPHAGVYDHPNKIGTPITYSVAFLGNDQETKVFEFRFGTETSDVGELLPFFDGFISQAVALSNSWYLQEKMKKI